MLQVAMLQVAKLNVASCKLQSCKLQVASLLTKTNFFRESQGSHFLIFVSYTFLEAHKEGQKLS